MTNILTQIKTCNNLSLNEQILARFILEYPNEFISYNAKQISKHCHISTTTIYRFCEKLNIAGLSDLKIQISGSLHNFQNEDQHFNFDFPINPHQLPQQIIEQLQEDYYQTILATKNLFQTQKINEIIKKMKKAKVIDIYTSAGNIFFAENFKFQMNEIGVQVNVPIDEYSQRLHAASSDEHHIAIFISFAGRGILADILPQILTMNNTPIFLISSLEFKPNYPTFCHWYLSSHENHYQKISSYSTRLSLLYLLDILYTCYFQSDYEANLKKKLDYYQKIANTNPK